MREYRDFSMKTIMVATDLSEASYGALSYAKQWAKRFSAKILLVHVVDRMRNESNRDKPDARLSEVIDGAEEELWRVTSALSYDDVRCASIVRSGRIRETIADLIDERDVDLLVIGTRGKGYKDGEELGSVAETLLRIMPCPVLTVGHGINEATHAKARIHASFCFQRIFQFHGAPPWHIRNASTEHLDGHLLLLHVDEQDADGMQPPTPTDEFNKLLREMQDPSLVTECLTRAGRPAGIHGHRPSGKGQPCRFRRHTGGPGTDPAGKHHAKLRNGFTMCSPDGEMPGRFTLFTEPRKEMHESGIKSDHALLIQPS